MNAAQQHHSSQVIHALAGARPERIVGASAAVAAIWAHSPVDATVCDLPQHAIALHLSGCTLVEKWRDGRLLGHQSRIGSVTLVPALVTTRWVLSGASRVAHLYVDPVRLAQTAQAASAPAPQLRDFFAEQDDALAALMRWVLAAGDAADPLAHEQMQVLVHRHLLTHYLEGSPAPAPERRITLTAAMLRRLFAHIESALGEALSLAELAQLARLSPDHFLRAFKAAVGQTPHQYVLDRRIARAQQLLAASAAPMAQIAREVGFQRASHFAAAFRQRTGVSPRGWRALH